MINALHFTSKLNRYSIIGSFLYGFLCALFPTPEVVTVIGYFLYFLSAALFYFVMYVFYSENRALVRHWWNNKWRIIGKILFWYALGIISIALTYMVVYHASYFEAVDRVAYLFSRVLHYIPFLP